jgi:ATP-dependent DNA helicase RecQ
MHRIPCEPTIIYVTLQRTAEAVAATLAAAGYDAGAYHAGMADDTRTATQERCAPPLPPATPAE